MSALTDRVNAIAAKARSGIDARGTTKPDPEAPKKGEPGPQPERTEWTVYAWGGQRIDVTLTEPLTQRQMRELYPEAAGIIPNPS